MDARYTGSFRLTYRPALGDTAIAVCLAGSIAALSTAGFALPIERIGFDGFGANEGPVAAPAAAPVRAAWTARKSAAFDVPQKALAAPLARPAPFDLAAISPSAPLRVEPVSALQRIRAVQEAALTVTPAKLPLPLVAAPQSFTQAALAAPAFAPALPAANSVSQATPVASEPALAAVVPATAPARIFPASASQAESAVIEPAPVAAPLAIISTPELRNFDLAKVRSGAKMRTAELAATSPASAKAAKGSVKARTAQSRVLGEDVFHQVSLSVAGSPGQSVDVRIGADLKPSLKVGDLLGLVADRLDPDSAARFAAAAAADEYVSLAKLRAAGFDVTYSAGSNTIGINVAN